MALLMKMSPVAPSQGQKVAAVAVLVLALLWRILGGPTQIILLMLGTAASFVAGMAGYLTLRLHFSPRFSKPAYPPKSALAMQQSILEAMEKKSLPEEQSAPHITRNIDQSINDIIDLISKDYVLRWVSHLMGSDKNAKAIFKQDFWILLNNLSSRLAKVDMVKLLATDVTKKVGDHFEKIRLVLSARQQQQSQSNSGNNAAKEGGSTNGSASGEPSSVKFPISPHLVSRDRELEYLSKVAEVLVILLCKHDYGNCAPVRHLLKEALARYVFLPAIELVTDPDYINSKILSYVKKHQSLRYLSRKAFVYADSYEDFVDMINGSSDIEELRQIRYNVLTEIMQATTMDNLRKAKANIIDEDDGSTKSSSMITVNPASKSQSSSITRYISQLLHVKSLCEKRLVDLGCDVTYVGNTVGEDNDAEDSGDNKKEEELATRKQLSFRTVMNSQFARKYFSAFLEEEGQKNLLAFWVAVQELKEADRTSWHHLATEIFYSFINKTDISMQVDKSNLKRIEAFLLGDSGPEVFFELQGQVQEMLRESYFPSFVMSDQCSSLLKDAKTAGVSLSSQEDVVFTANTEDDDDDCSKIDQAGSSQLVPFSSAKTTSSELFSGLSGVARNQLDYISERLQNKLQAMSALKNSLKPDSRILTMLQQEVENLGEEKKAVESHITRTESWADNLGSWQCHVQSLEYGEDTPGGGESALKAVLVVYLPEEGFRGNEGKGGRAAAAAAAMAAAAMQSTPPSSPTSAAGVKSATTWTCVRKISDFHGLHRDMVPFVGWVKGLDLPSQSKSVFLRTPNSRAALEKGRGMLQKFMDRILEDEQLSRSELLYSFLVYPHPGYPKSLQHAGNSPRANKTSFPSLPNFFKSEGNQIHQMSHPLSLAASGNAPPADNVNDDGDDAPLWFDEFDASARRGTGRNAAGEEQQQKDVIAESLYRLIGEVFDMRGVFRLLRKSLMTFVQITYGSTINRQIRDTVAWLTSEQMILYYLSSFRKAYWHPNGQPREAIVNSSTSENEDKKAALAAEAREALVQDIPEMIISLVGQQAAVSGTVKVFEALQNPTLNKQLLYDVLEMTLCELFPEISSTHGPSV